MIWGRKWSVVPYTFAGLGLPAELVEELDRRLITEPFEIQRLAIPDALVGRDILGRAPTGSGKTLAFGLPLLARLDRGAKRRPRGLILSPTRELAEQICRDLEPLAAAVDRSVLAVYGGTGLTKQVNALRRGVDLLVACPGRLLDLIDQGAVRLDDVDIVVVDEADRMADMGFLPDVRKLLDQTAAERQTVLFSATLDHEVQVLIDTYQDDPVVHEVGEIEPDLTLVDHRFIKVKKVDRVWLAADLIADAGPTVVFVRTRHGVDRLARQLKGEGIAAGYIHGGRTQAQRDRALQVFTDGKVQALVATDVAARGIHVDGVTCVIHYDPPAEIKDYVHRSGRTARAGAGGTVVSFLDPPQVKESQKMQRTLGIEAEIEPLPARKPRSSRPEPIVDRRQKRNGKGEAGAAKPARKRGDGRGPAKRTSRTAAGSDAEARSTTERSSKPKRAAGRPAADGSTKAQRSTAKRSTAKRSTAKPSAAERSAAERSTTPRAKAKSDDGPRSAKPKRARTATTRSSTSGTGRATPSAARPDGSAPKLGKPKSKAKAKTVAAAGSKQKTAGKAKAKATKRSGKPRPKNRKNKPRTGRRR